MVPRGLQGSEFWVRYKLEPKVLNSQTSLKVALRAAFAAKDYPVQGQRILISPLSG